MKLTLILLFLSVACYAQQPPRTDTAALYRQWEAELNREVPVYLLCGSNKKNSSRALYYVRSYQKGGVNLDSRKRPIPAWVIVFAVMPREEK